MQVEPPVCSWSALPEECLDLCVEWATFLNLPMIYHLTLDLAYCKTRDLELDYLKTRVSLSLLDRAARHRFEQAWLAPGAQNRLAQRLAVVVAECPIQSLVEREENWARYPALRLASFGDAYYEAIAAQCAGLRGAQTFLASWRFKPVGGHRILTLKPVDYNALKPVLQRLYKYFGALSTREQLVQFMDLQALALESTRCSDLALRMDVGDSTPLGQLYVYGEKFTGDAQAEPYVVHPSQCDLRRLVPLREATRRGTKGQLCALKTQRIKDSPYTHWVARVQQMQLLTRPLKTLADAARARHKAERKEKKREKRKKRK